MRRAAYCGWRRPRSDVRIRFAGRNRSRPFVKDQERADGDEEKAERVIPSQRLLQVQHREAGEHHQRDHLLHGLELRRHQAKVMKTLEANSISIGSSVGEIVGIDVLFAKCRAAQWSGYPVPSFDII